MQGQLKLTCLFKLFFVYSVFDVTGVFAVAGAKCVQRALLSPSLFAVFFNAGTAEAYMFV